MRDRSCLNKHSFIVDLGCGSGNLTYPLSRIADKIIGIDISNTLISIAKKKYPQTIQWICDDVSNFDFQKKSYDLVVSYE
jgi:2-polyprenyl-3-methyl-5-hydroxy-6-metoxy-1,4-benzoquinol methylase